LDSIYEPINVEEESNLYEIISGDVDYNHGFAIVTWVRPISGLSKE